MSVYFIHCNFCGKQPQSGMRYFTAECGHVACNFCKEKRLTPACTLCKRKVGLQEIGPNMQGKQVFMNQSQIINNIALHMEKLDAAEPKTADEHNYMVDPVALQTAVREMFPIRRTLGDSDDESADPNIDAVLYKQADISMNNTKQAAKEVKALINYYMPFLVNPPEPCEESCEESCEQ